MINSVEDITSQLTADSNWDTQFYPLTVLKYGNIVNIKGYYEGNSNNPSVILSGLPRPFIQTVESGFYTSVYYQMTSGFFEGYASQGGIYALTPNNNKADLTVVNAGNVYSGVFDMWYICE